MHERLLALCKKIHAEWLEKAYEHETDKDIGEYVADSLIESGVIHIPCKVGDMVYQTDGVRIYDLTIFDISLRKNKPYYETESVDFDDDAIGKSIFLTRQEAMDEAKKYVDCITDHIARH